MKNITASTDIDIVSDTYVRASDFADHIGGVHFPVEVWAVFAQCDVARTPTEIALRARLDVADVHSALRRLSSKHLIRKNEIDWLAYLTSLGTPPAAVVEAPAAEEAPAAKAPAVAPAITITVPREAVVAAVPTSSAPPPAAVPPAPQTLQAAAPAPIASAAQPLAFRIDNVSAAIARRLVAREVLTFHVGKTSAREAGPGLAA